MSGEAAALVRAQLAGDCRWRAIGFPGRSRFNESCRDIDLLRRIRDMARHLRFDPVSDSFRSSLHIIGSGRNI